MKRCAWTLPLGMLPAATPSLSTRVLPAPIAATSRVSGHARAKMEWPLLPPCGARGAATPIYPPSGGELVPLVFEAGGRPADETVAFVRSWASEADEADRLMILSSSTAMCCSRAMPR